MAYFAAPAILVEQMSAARHILVGSGTILEDTNTEMNPRRTTMARGVNEDIVDNVLLLLLEACVSSC